MSASRSPFARVLLKETVGEKLRHVRELRALSLRALARRAQVLHHEVVRYEAGRVLPDAYTLLRLADALDCSTDYLLGRS